MADHESEQRICKGPPQTPVDFRIQAEEPLPLPPHCSRRAFTALPVCEFCLWCLWSSVAVGALVGSLFAHTVFVPGGLVLYSHREPYFSDAHPTLTTFDNLRAGCIAVGFLLGGAAGYGVGSFVGKRINLLDLAMRVWSRVQESAVCIILCMCPAMGIAFFEMNGLDPWSGLFAGATISFAIVYGLVVRIVIRLGRS